MNGEELDPQQWRLVRRYRGWRPQLVQQMASAYFVSPRGSMGEEVEPTWLERANEYGRRRFAQEQAFWQARKEGRL